MPKAHPIDTILNGRLCSGCGGCEFVGRAAGVTMVDYPNVNRRPHWEGNLPIAVKDQMAACCPGAIVEPPAAALPTPRDPDEILVGPTQAVVRRQGQPRAHHLSAQRVVQIAPEPPAQRVQQVGRLGPLPHRVVEHLAHPLQPRLDAAAQRDDMLVRRGALRLHLAAHLTPGGRRMLSILSILVGAPGTPD